MFGCCVFDNVYVCGGATLSLIYSVVGTSLDCGVVLGVFYAAECSGRSWRLLGLLGVTNSISGAAALSYD